MVVVNGNTEHRHDAKGENRCTVDDHPEPPRLMNVGILQGLSRLSPLNRSAVEGRSIRIGEVGAWRP